MYKGGGLSAYLSTPVHCQVQAPSPFISHTHHIVRKSYAISSWSSVRESLFLCEKREEGGEEVQNILLALGSMLFVDNFLMHNLPIRI